MNAYEQEMRELNERMEERNRVSDAKKIVGRWRAWFFARLAYLFTIAGTWVFAFGCAGTVPWVTTANWFVALGVSLFVTGLINAVTWLAHHS